MMPRCVQLKLGQSVVMEGRGNRILVNIVTCIILCWGLIACGSPPDTVVDEVQLTVDPNAIAETAPPFSVRSLQTQLEPYQPQVQILSPAPESTLTQTNVEVRLDVQDFPVFKDEELQLGPHLQVILDNTLPISIYDPGEPLVFEGVGPGTHLLRVFAVSPWGESFKNEGAYTQAQFSVLTRDRNNQPSPDQPLLTYNSPQGVYGAEPVLLDFFLTNAPLRWPSELVLDESDLGDAVSTPDDWRIRITVNEQSFLLDEWQSLYIEGLQPGLNWVKLEFIDAQGQPVDNVFNNTVRLVEYQPESSTPLDELIAGRIPVELQTALVDPDYRDRLQALEGEVIKEIADDAGITKEFTDEAELIEESLEGEGTVSESSDDEGIVEEFTDEDEQIPSVIVEPIPLVTKVELEALPDQLDQVEVLEEVESSDELDAIAPLDPTTLDTAPGLEEQLPEFEAIPKKSRVEETTDTPLILDAEGIPVDLPSAITATPPLPEDSEADELDDLVVVEDLEIAQPAELDIAESDAIAADEDQMPELDESAPVVIEELVPETAEGAQPSTPDDRETAEIVTEEEQVSDASLPPESPASETLVLE